MNVSWDDDIPNIWKNKKCSKAPTKLYIYGLTMVFNQVNYSGLWMFIVQL